MTIGQLGSVGEFIAAIATLATLIYLALQIRQTSQLLENAAHRGIQDDADRWRSYMVNNKDVAALYRTGLINLDDLDADDKFRYRMLQDQLFFGWQYAYFARNKTLENTQKNFLRDTLAQPGGTAYWERSKERFDDEFVEYVAECLHQHN